MAKSFQDIMAEARKEIPEASPQQVNELLKNNGKSPVLLDVRESDEWRQGHLEGAIPLPRGFLEIKVETAIPDKNTPIIAYCAGGVRSLLAAKVMREMGYQNVTSMAGGYGAWKNGGFKWVQDFQYTPEQLIRYSRHFLLPEVGEDGQAKLLQAKVLMVGAGGLGSPSAYYLAAAGVGTLGIIDNDVVDISNLQRQILHANDRVGMPKVESAKKTLGRVESGCEGDALSGQAHVREHHGDLEGLRPGDRRLRQLSQRAIWSTMLACSPASPTSTAASFSSRDRRRFSIRAKAPAIAACIPSRHRRKWRRAALKPASWASFPGSSALSKRWKRSSSFSAKATALVGRLLHFNTLTMEINTLKLRRDPNCPMCGDNPTIKELIDYEEFCSLRH